MRVQGLVCLMTMFKDVEFMGASGLTTSAFKHLGKWTWNREEALHLKPYSFFLKTTYSQ